MLKGICTMNKEEQMIHFMNDQAPRIMQNIIFKQFINDFLPNVLDCEIEAIDEQNNTIIFKGKDHKNFIHNHNIQLKKNSLGQEIIEYKSILNSTVNNDNIYTLTIALKQAEENQLIYSYKEQYENQNINFSQSTSTKIRTISSTSQENIYVIDKMKLYHTLKEKNQISKQSLKIKYHFPDDHLNDYSVITKLEIPNQNPIVHQLTNKEMRALSMSLQMHAQVEERRKRSSYDEYLEKHPVFDFEPIFTMSNLQAIHHYFIRSIDFDETYLKEQLRIDDTDAWKQAQIWNQTYDPSKYYQKIKTLENRDWIYIMV